ncbi:MAG: hypothetical protein R2883_06535 [Caldisericia bacterium]
MLDGIGDSGYVFDGKDMFFKKLQEFSDENYSKAKIDVPRHYTRTILLPLAIGYGVANKKETNFQFDLSGLNLDTYDDRITEHDFVEILKIWVLGNLPLKS